MTTPRRFAAVALAAALALTACGGDDDESTAAGTAPTVAPAPDSTEPTGSGDATDDAVGGPTPTISPDLPDEFLPGVGPMALEGDALDVLPETGDDPAIGERAPVIVAETVDGEPIRVDAAADGPTWVIFLAHWCPHCNDEVPVINQLRDEGRVPDDLDVVAVSTAANPGRPNWPPVQWLEDKDWTYTAVLDGVDVEGQSYIAADGFGLSAFPFSVLIDADGNVVDRWAGESEADVLAERIAQPLGG